MESNDSNSNIKRLRDLCLKLICSNLCVTYEICKRNSWKIPTDYGTLIYEYFIENNYPINENDLNLFTSSITSLKSFFLNGKFNDYSNFLLNINKDYLRTIKCFLYDYRYGLKNLLNLLENCENIEKFELYCYCNNYPLAIMEVPNEFNLFINSLNNSSSTLTELIIFHEKVIKVDFNIEIIMKNCNKLNIFKFDGLIEDFNKYCDIFKSIMSSKNTLKEFFLTVAFNNHSIRYFYEFLENCQNIEILSIVLYNSHSSFIVEFAKCIQLLKKNLKSVSISIHHLDLYFNGLLEFFLTNFSSIQSIELKNNSNYHHFNCDAIFMTNFPYEYCNENLFAKLCKEETKVDNLKRLEIKKLQIQENSMVKLGKIMKSVRKIEYFELDYVFAYGNYQISLINGLSKNINKFIINFYFNFDTIREYEFFEEFFQRCNYHNMNINIYFQRMEDVENRFSYVIRGISDKMFNLTGISLINANLNSTESFQLGDSLRSISTIQFIRLNNNQNMADGFESICNGLVSSGKKLREIQMIDCNLNENHGIYIANLLKSCSNIIVFKIEKNVKFINSLENITNELSKCCHQLKELGINWNKKSAAKNFITNFDKLFKKCLNLKHLNISFKNSNFFMDDERIQICEIIKNLSFKKIKLNNYQLPDHLYTIPMLKDWLFV